MHSALLTFAARNAKLTERWFKTDVNAFNRPVCGCVCECGGGVMNGFFCVHTEKLFFCWVNGEQHSSCVLLLFGLQTNRKDNVGPMCWLADNRAVYSISNFFLSQQKILTSDWLSDIRWNLLNSILTLNSRCINLLVSVVSVLMSLTAY